ncbi:unnamed protein product [Chrysoparadoxa australica]
MIGTGAFARVYKASCSEKGKDVAIKIMDLENVVHSFDDIRQEVNVMRMCEHPNVVPCYCSFVHDKELWLVMEYMDKGSCLHVMNSAKKKGKGDGMQEEWIAYVLKETLQGLNYFHQNGHIHRDIKAGNILLSKDGRVQLGDFGVAGWLVGYGKKRNTAKTFVGTPCWMAPEVMEQTEGYNQKADIWSVGITALELAKGFAPYANLEPMKVLMRTIEQDPPSLRSYSEDTQAGGGSFSRNFKEIVRLCLQKNPKKRPTCQILLNHKFFKSTSNKSLIEDLLNDMDSVGDGSPPASAKDRLPGTRPGSFYANTGNAAETEMKLDDTVRVNSISVQGGGVTQGHRASIPDDHPKGTTWVFEDGSQVVLKADDSKQAQAAHQLETDDFLNEFEEQVADEDFKTKKGLQERERQKAVQQEQEQQEGMLMSQEQVGGNGNKKYWEDRSNSKR